jgi:hypothetical protein
MNARIRELAEQAGIAVWGDAVYMYDPKDTLDSTVMAKFAELIVRECVGICKGKTDHLDPNMYEVWRGALACASDIKVHFGVEE